MHTLRAYARHLTLAALATVAVVFALVLMPVLPAFAHAAYVSSDPKANEVLKSDPNKVTITFAQNLDPKGLSIVVYDADGKVVSKGEAQISSTNPKAASVAMTGDSSDVYRVDWHTVSAEDGEATLGAFVFGVDPSGQSDKVKSDASAPAAVPAAPAPALTPLGIILGIVIGLIVGVGAMFAMNRQRVTSKV